MSGEGVDIKCVLNSPVASRWAVVWGYYYSPLFPLVSSYLSFEIYARFCLPSNPHKNYKQGCGMIGKYLYIARRYKAEVRCRTALIFGLLLYIIISYYVQYKYLR